MNKETIRKQIVEALQKELELLTDAARLARDEAISDESRPENQYDMHSQEAAYLAEGQARIATETRENVELYQSLTLPEFTQNSPIALGALVELAAINGSKKSSWYFVGPRAGGLELNIDGLPVLVITPSSPLGRELVGRCVGEMVRAPGRDNQPLVPIATVL